MPSINTSIKDIADSLSPTDFKRLLEAYGNKYGKIDGEDIEDVSKNLVEGPVRAAIYSFEMTELLQKIYHDKPIHVSSLLMLLFQLEVLIDNEDADGSVLEGSFLKLMEQAENPSHDSDTYPYAEIQEAMWLKAFPKYNKITA